MFEHFFQCPYCWENISMLLDMSVNDSYIEDCEVCCNPIKITYSQEERTLVSFTADGIEQ